MKRLVRNMTLVMIVLSTTQVINIRMINMSMYQLVLLCVGFLAVIEILSNGRIKKGRYAVFAALYGASSILAFVLSTNKEWAQSLLLVGIMTVEILLLICNYFERSDINVLVRSLIRSQYITIAFSIYSFIMFYFGGGLPLEISLGIFEIQLSEDFLRRAQAASQLRMTLPYATPPVLSVVMAMCILILLFNKNIFDKIKRCFLIVVFSVILILCGSRTGLVGLIIALFIYLCMEILHNTHYSKKAILGLIVVGGTLIIVFLGLTQTVYMQKFLRRFTNIDVTTDRHILVPLDGLIIWLSSFKNFVFGIGFGSSINMQGAHTYLPAYFLNSLVTFVVERGIMGLLIDFELLRILFKGLKGLCTKVGSDKSIIMALFVAIISSLFYEILHCYFIIIVIAIMFMMQMRKEEENENNISDCSGV